MASQGTISGGTDSHSTCDWIVRSFALVPLSVSPTGTVSFQVEPSGGSWSTYNSQTLSSGTATSASYAPNGAGTWYFRAVYGGDSTNAGSQSADTAEPLTVNQATPSLGFSPSSYSVTVGGSATPSATVTGVGGITPTGTLSFYYSTDGGSNWNLLGTTSGLSGTGNAASATATLSYSPLSVSSNYKFGVTYSGDTNYAAVSTKVTVALTVNLASPSLGTTAPNGAVVGVAFHDSAALTGGYSAGGQLLTSCIVVLMQLDLRWVLIVLSLFQAVVPDSDPFTVTSAGSYYFTASYSGDSNNNGVPVTSGEAFTVGMASPSLGAPLSPSGAVVGTAFSATATLSGGYSAGGTVTYTLYTSGGTQVGSPATENVNNGVVAAASFTASSAGNYYIKVTYSGDSNNNPVSTPDKAQPLQLGIW